jgi:hypothetical protein
MRLLSLKSGPSILKLLKSLEEESKAIIQDIATLAIYSNQSYNDMWNISPEEKDIFVKILKDKISLDRGIKPKDILSQERI